MLKVICIGRWAIAMLLAWGSWAHADETATVQARAVMDEFIVQFNARDEAKWADTLLFPHVRVASGSVVVVPDKASFVAATDLDEFARLNNWDHSEWDAIEVIQSGPDKVHFKVTFSRFNPDGERYVTYDSLYIVQRVEGRWGIRARSSFAP
jgi:hypothetical protein